MKKINGYDKAEVITSQERLPAGGYVLRIMGAKVEETEWGDKLVISFDVAEGEHKDYYAENYRAQTGEDKKWKGVYRLNIPAGNGSDDDNMTMRRFKTAMTMIEESNKGYHWDWDESKLKGKFVGGVFRNKEYDYKGRQGFFTECAWLETADNIRNGKFKPAPDKLLNKQAAQTVANNNNSLDIVADDDGDLPF